MIVFEEEVIPTKDFLHFMSQCWASLNKDPTLIGISAWNENGKATVRLCFGEGGFERFFWGGLLPLGHIAMVLTNMSCCLLFQNFKHFAQRTVFLRRQRHHSITQCDRLVNS